MTEVKVFSTILLVDDNEDLLEFLSDDLAEEYNVLAATNGSEALKMMEEHSIDLIISDIMMPVMDGMELCETIKNDVELSHIPVILLTAKNTLESKISGLNSGADAYVEKPFSPEYLRAQIGSLLKNRNKIKEYFINSPLTHIKSIAHSRSDEIFLEELNRIILENISDINLDVNQLAIFMNMSRPTLYRKIKSISDLTPNEMINITRLKQAAVLLAEDNLRINEIYNVVGYSSPSQFGRNFQKQFKMTPSEYIRSLRSAN